MMKRGWQHHEAYVNELLGLDSTVSSGSRWHDQGDGVDRSHPSQNGFAMISDCKYTEKLSYSIKYKDLQEWQEKAAEMGKRFIMPIRFWNARNHHDFVLLSLNDFAELVEKSRPQSVSHDRGWVDYDEYRRWGNG